MTDAQLFSQARLLTPAEKFTLVELLLRDLREAAASSLETQMRHPLDVDEKLSIVKQLGGFLRPAGGTTPTDDEIRDGYPESTIPILCPTAFLTALSSQGRTSP